eukprot:TRINITY_DN13782_c1_g1_i1.p1 TRINITY_DN13782_c1_g1~~TRINITY_DN13782_c1_g1_i1.p1  ORF type:complete len:256 (-),score=59.30 TRINITY_DN13782_c1_g1_i1:164-880(-)
MAEVFDQDLPGGSSGSDSKHLGRSFQTEVQLLKDGGVFQVVRDRDWDQAFHPDPSATVDADQDAAILGPDPTGFEHRWSLKGKAGDIFRIRFHRHVLPSGSDERSLSWSFERNEKVHLDTLLQGYHYCIVGSWSDFTKREKMIKKDEQTWTAEVTVGKAGCETFQVLLNDNWLAAVYPNTNEAHYNDSDHKLLGPDDAGTSLFWRIGGDKDNVGAGDTVKVELKVVGGMPQSLRWERL